MRFLHKHLLLRILNFVCIGASLGWTLTGCAGKSEHTLGVAPAKEVTTEVKSLTSASSKSQVTLQGEMIEKCPVAGCWFMLKDKTGVVRVDTKTAGFVVSDVPLHTKMTVSGTVTTGAETGLAATGIRY